MSKSVSEIIEPNLYNDDGTINVEYISKVSEIIEDGGLL